MSLLLAFFAAILVAVVADGERGDSGRGVAVLLLTVTLWALAGAR